MKNLLALSLITLLALTPLCADARLNAVAGGGGGSAVSVTASTPDIVVNPSPGTGTFTVGAANVINPQGTTTPYTILSSDMGKTITHNKSTAVSVTLPQAGTTGFASGSSFTDINLGAGTVTITPTTSTINGQSNIGLAQYQFAYITSDGANYVAAIGSSLAGAGTVTSVTPGAGVATSITGGTTAITTSGTVYADASYFPNYLGGFTLSNDGSSPNTVIDTTAGSAVSDDSTVMMKLSAFTKTTGSWALATGNGCLDTGSVANSTWYYLFVIERTDTGVVDELCSASATSPTMPTSYTKKRLVGAFKTNGSAQIIGFTQTGTRVEWNAAVLDVNDTTLGTSAVLETLGSVPPALGVQPICRYTLGNTGNSVLLSSPSVTDIAPTTTNPFSAAPGFDQLDVNLTGGDENSACPDLITNTSGQIRARSTASSTTLAIVTKGWRY